MNMNQSSSHPSTCSDEQEYRTSRSDGSFSSSYDEDEDYAALSPEEMHGLAREARGNAVEQAAISGSKKADERGSTSSPSLYGDGDEDEESVYSDEDHTSYDKDDKISLKKGLMSTSKATADPLQHRRTVTEIPSTPTNASTARWILEKYQLFRYQCGTFVNHPKMQIFIVVLIAVNAIMMGIGTYDFVENNPKLDSAFETTDHIFLIIFTIELGLQFMYRGWRILSDGWLLFDLVVITLSWSLDSFQIIRAFRVLRALRLITRVKVMQNLVIALFGVVPRMFAIGLLLMLVSYIFAVMLTELFQDSFEDGVTEIDYFGSLFGAFFTLFQYMTMDDWASSVRELNAEYPLAWLPVVVFIIVTSFVVVNLIIAVICDAISALHDDDKAKLHGTFESEDDQDTQSGSTVSRYSLRKDLHAQLDALEENVDELMRMQEETMLALRGLAEYVAEKKLRKLAKRRRSSASTKRSSSGRRRNKDMPAPKLQRASSAPQPATTSTPSS